jgi:hypothetical protein
MVLAARVREAGGNQGQAVFGSKRALSMPLALHLCSAGADASLTGDGCHVSSVQCFSCIRYGLPGPQHAPVT